MIRHQEVDLLLNYTVRDGVAISFFLNTDWSERSRGQWEIEAKDLIKTARKEISDLQLNRRFVEAAEDDLRRIQSLLLVENLAKKHKSLAVFSNSADHFYQIYRLPVPIKSRLIVDSTFYVRPLQALLEERCRLGVVLIDSRNARLFEIYMDEVLEHTDFTTTKRIQRKPLLETFMKREKRLMQRKEEDTRFHVASVADLVRSHFSRNHFDKLIIGAKKPLGDHLARLLTRKLQENLIGISEIDIHESENEVLSKAKSIEASFELEREKRLVSKIEEEIEKDGRAVKGLRNTVEMLHDYNLQTLIVGDDFSEPGLVCPKCGMPHTDGKTCVCCGEELTFDNDIVYDITEEAAHQGAAVRHIHSPELISPLGNIAAIIKFRRGELIFPQEAVETEA